MVRPRRPRSAHKLRSDIPIFSHSLPTVTAHHFRCPPRPSYRQISTSLFYLILFSCCLFSSPKSEAETTTRREIITHSFILTAPSHLTSFLGCPQKKDQRSRPHPLNQPTTHIPDFQRAHNRASTPPLTRHTYTKKRKFRNYIIFIF